MRTLQVMLVLAVSFSMTGCEAIGRIFQAGVWVGVIMVLVVLGLVALIVSRFR
jgi:hypothetical protein